MAALSPAFVKIDLNRLGLSDCAAEIRNVVYKEYFRGGKLRVLPTLFAGLVLSKDKRLKKAETSLLYAAILLCSKRIYSEALPLLYDNKTFEIVDKSVWPGHGWGSEISRTASLRDLPSPMISNIKLLSFDIESFGYAVARLDNSEVVGTRRQLVTLDAWTVALKHMPKLEVLTIQCRDWLEPRHLALRFVTNVHLLCNTTDITFELNVHGQDYERGVQVEADWEGLDCVSMRGPKDVTIPAVKKLVVVGWLFPQELEEVKKMTFGGQRFLESERRRGCRFFHESMYYTGNHRLREIGHSKVKFEGESPRTYDDTEISRYTYSLTAVPIEEGMKSMSLGQDTKKAAAA